MNEHPPNCEVEDGLPQLPDMFIPSAQERNVTQVEIRMLAQFLHMRFVAKMVKRRHHKSIPSALPLCLRCFQLITQRHQFIHFGDDAVLFC